MDGETNLRRLLDPADSLDDQSFVVNFKQMLASTSNGQLELKQKIALHLLELCCGSIADNSKLLSLPVECSVWVVKRKIHDGHILREVHDQTGRTLAIISYDLFEDVSEFVKIGDCANDNPYNTIQEVMSCLCVAESEMGSESTCSTNTAVYMSLLSAACFSPLIGQPRRPLAIYDRHFPLTDGHTSQIFPFPIGKVIACVCLMRPRAVPFRTCHHCGYQAEDSMFITCGGCDVVFYCSAQCASQDTVHKEQQCGKIQYYKEIAPQLTNFPFTFTELVCNDRFDDGVISDYLRDQGIYNLGMWVRETPACLHCSTPPAYGELDVSLDPYVLPCEGMILEDVTTAPVSPLESWNDYYIWRGFDMSSPIAVLMHTVLTVYHIIQISGFSQKKSLMLILAAVDKEADYVVTFFELSVLLPDTQIDIVMVGPLISDKVSGSKVEHGNLTVTRYSTTLQDYLKYSPESGDIDLIIGLNAGLAAYPSWRDAVTSVTERKIKCFVTDFCLLSLDMSQQALNSLVSSLQPSLDALSLSDDTQTCVPTSLHSQVAVTCPRLSEPYINPFRNPFRKFCDTARLAWFSNAFICELSCN